MLIDGEGGMAIEERVAARRRFTRDVTEAGAPVSPQAFPDVTLTLAQIFA